MHHVGNFISFTFKKPNKFFSVVDKLYNWTTYFASVLTEISQIFALLENANIGSL